ncbi:MAG: class I SAM-dependent methyltransferase, partial [Halodesulfurarchaeum sp.]
MPLTDPFERYTDRYDEWFDLHPEAFESEVAALQALRPEGATGLEIGVGTGRFAERLGIEVGIDPAGAVLPVAAERGASVARGVAESLPVRDDSFGLALVVTTICFVDDVSATLAEAARVLRPGGSVLLGYIDRESEVGQHYQDIQD